MIASEVERARAFEADESHKSSVIGLKDSPIFAFVQCRWLLSMLKMRSRCGFATLSTSAISLRGLAYFARGRAEHFSGFEDTQLSMYESDIGIQNGCSLIMVSVKGGEFVLTSRAFAEGIVIHLYWTYLFYRYQPYLSRCYGLSIM